MKIEVESSEVIFLRLYRKELNYRKIQGKDFMEKQKWKFLEGNDKNKIFEIRGKNQRFVEVNMCEERDLGGYGGFRFDQFGFFSGVEGGFNFQWGWSMRRNLEWFLIEIKNCWIVIRIFFDVGNNLVQSGQV